MDKKIYLVFFFVFLIVLSFFQKELPPEVQREFITSAGDSPSNPKVAIQHPAGVDIFNITHSGQVSIRGNLSIVGSGKILHIDIFNSTDTKIWME